jgi:hypothetical protein
MQPGDLVRVTYRDLIYTTRRGGNCIGAADKGEIMMVVEGDDSSHNIKILHPVHGLGFITRAFTEVLSDR